MKDLVSRDQTIAELSEANHQLQHQLQAQQQSSSSWEGQVALLQKEVRELTHTSVEEATRRVRAEKQLTALGLQAHFAANQRVLVRVKYGQGKPDRWCPGNVVEVSPQSQAVKVEYELGLGRRQTAWVLAFELQSNIKLAA